MTSLQRLTLPTPGLCGETQLYLRTAAASVSYYQGNLSLPEQCRVQFDTYFNAFSVEGWRTYSAVDDLGVVIRGQGKVHIKIMHSRSGWSTNCVAETVAVLDEDGVRINLDNWRQYGHGILFVELQALAPVEVAGIDYITETKATKDVRLGIVVTHFNRREWVVPAMERLDRDLLGDAEFSGRVSVFVVDNSNNLALQNERITVIPNRNYGGSGGFTRGLMACQRQSLSHCIFMDDDATCEIESVRRAIHLLSFASREDLAVSGALLDMANPSRVLEHGVAYDAGLIRPRHMDADVKETDELLNLERHTPDAAYGAWWFYAFPIARIEKHPFPFFVRGDDIMFGILNSFHTASMIGICCWGEDFALKENPTTRYLGTRSTLAIMIGATERSRISTLFFLARSFAAAAFSYNYSSARCISLAIKHVLEGEHFWRENMDMQAVRQEIAQEAAGEKMVPMKVDRHVVTSRALPERKIRFIIRLLTLNGFLVPQIFFRDTTAIEAKSFRAPFRSLFLRRSVIYYSETLGTGYIAEHDKKRFFTELAVFLRLCFSLIRRFKKLRVEYGRSFSTLSSSAFWEGVYAPADDRVEASKSC